MKKCFGHPNLDFILDKMGHFGTNYSVKYAAFESLVSDYGKKLVLECVSKTLRYMTSPFSTIEDNLKTSLSKIRFSVTHMTHTIINKDASIWSYLLDR